MVMAPIKIVEVISFSNEDPKHPADNLLKTDSYQKWKCVAGCTEKQVHVILKLESLTTITSIDIGNESSAFVEVLAGREGVDYKILLAASSFMSPLEARNNTQTNRVRLFPIDKLTKATAEEKWDRIKIICTQPFNKSLQYGLSFVKLHSIEKVDSTSASRHSIGAFILSDPESDQDPIKVGAFFQNLKKDASLKNINSDRHEKDSPSRKTLDKVQLAPNAPDVGFYQLKKQEKFRKRPLEEEACRSDEIKKQKKQDETETRMEKPKVKEPVKPKNPEVKLQTSRTEEPTVKKKHRPFSKLLSDVLFVMSGYQNPLRTELREKMTEMGARYKSDWDNRCTHLLCAFKNTPKYRAVKDKGIVVSEKWTEDCYTHKKRFSSTRYFLEKGQSPLPEEEEIWADEIMPKSTSDPSEKNEKHDIPVKSKDLSDYDAETEDEEDTDDEIRRVLANQKKTNNSPEDDIYDADTDIDDDNQIQDTSHIQLPSLPDYFKGKVFYVYGSMDEEKLLLIKRYIIGFNGIIEDYMTKEVNYVITEDSWDQHFDDALSDNANLQFVRPQWIWRCSEKRRFVPPQPFVVVPKDTE